MKRARRPPLVQRRWRSGLGGGQGGGCSRRPANRSQFLTPPFSARPPSATPTASFQRRHITMQPAFTVRLRAPRANWTPHKAGHNPPPPPLWVLSAGTLYQVLNATAEAMNEIMGVGAAWRRGWSSSTGESGHVWGGGGFQIPELSVLSHCSGIQRCSAGQDPPILSSKVSPPLTHHAAPLLIPVTSRPPPPPRCHKKTTCLFFCNRKSEKNRI